MKLHPLEDRIVVRPGESEETTASGLVIPDTAKEKPQQGEVLAAGPGRRAETSGELIPIDPRIIATARSQAAQVTRGAGGGLAWPGLLRKLDRLDGSYKD